MKKKKLTKIIGIAISEIERLKNERDELLATINRLKEKIVDTPNCARIQKSVSNKVFTVKPFRTGGV
jgi:hypothetical protein